MSLIGKLQRCFPARSVHSTALHQLNVITEWRNVQIRPIAAYELAFWHEFGTNAFIEVTSVRTVPSAV